MLAKQFGGAERSFVDICRALASRGHEILAICENRSEALNIVQQFTDVAVKSVTVHGSWDLFARRTIRQYLEEFDPDIAQMHLARAAYLAGPVARRLGIPSVAKTHNYVNPKYYRTISKMVPTTARQQEYLRLAGISDERISRIPNFSAIAPVATIGEAGKTTGAPLRVVGIGRLVKKKGFDLLLHAVAVAKQGGLELTLAIAGSGSERDALERLSCDLNLEDVVTFLGWQDNVRACLCAADVFVLPSREEPFGIVCLEAMALRVPIIATRTDGPCEILDEHSAILIDGEDPDVLAQALQRIASEPDQAVQRSMTAQQHFARNYSEQAVVTQYLALYADLLESAGHSNDA